jgi:hypothetical protein
MCTPQGEAFATRYELWPQDVLAEAPGNQVEHYQLELSGCTVQVEVMR